jgi:Holliday junction resolvase RusA-like endonuclease
MRATVVVVPGIAPKDALEMALIDDEKVVEALGSDSPNEPLRIGVRVRRPEWG